ncbi:DUF4097 family beta strand repeat-containing protein [Streptomyces sp. NPDC048172]|uniref:DUF4097 family beta strand repeat-containing protein n=1 Tax=Streptomyces sp. NPDC048172 TaxID=3365505 RepID=UPI003714E9AE
MQKFETPTPVSAVLDIPAGRVQLIAADRADTTVEVLPLNPAKSRDAKAAERIAVEFADGVVRITAPEAKNQLLGNSGSVEVTVQLPAGSRVEAATAAADLRGVGRLGDVVLDGAQGAVKIDQAASVRLTVSDGSVEIGRLDGPGEITVDRGDLTVAEAVRGTVTLATRQGSISVGAARGVSASLDAGTAYGRVSNSLRNAEGDDAPLAIHATTDQGDITARSL